MKNTILVLAFLIGAVSFGQEKRELKLNKETNLIDVTFYHDNGVVSQTGAYTLDGKLQGEWLSYNTEGKKLVKANYNNGLKSGKWFYWNDKLLTEVDYLKNGIASVKKWESKDALASRDK